MNVLIQYAESHGIIQLIGILLQEDIRILAAAKQFGCALHRGNDWLIHIEFGIAPAPNI